LNALPACWEDIVLLEGSFDEFTFDGHRQPIRFKQNDRYGYFPQMKEAKYKSVGSFVGHLAEVVFEDGSKGWIDLDGKEIRGRKE